MEQVRRLYAAKIVAAQYTTRMIRGMTLCAIAGDLAEFLKDLEGAK